MKKFWIILILVMLCLAIFTCTTMEREQTQQIGQIQTEQTIEQTAEEIPSPSQVPPPVASIAEIENLEIPLCIANNSEKTKGKKDDRHDTHQIVQHLGYTLCYREKFEQPEWVAYTLDASKLQKNTSRKNNFREDPAVKTFSAALEDYKNSGYDRGHLAPAADMAYDEEIMSESFFLSNMSPQTHAFNAGIWLRLEDCVRKLAAEHEKIFVVTGPILEKGDYPTIGVNKVAVPEFFYKALLLKDGNELKMLAFIVPHEAGKGNFLDYQCAVDEIENRTGLDFFWQLDDEIENELESKVESMVK